MFTQTDGQIFERTTIFTVRAEQVFLCCIHPQDLTSLLGKGGEELVSRGKLRQWQHSSCNLERGIEHQMFRIDSDWSWTHQSQGAPDPSYFKPLFAPRSSPAHSSPANGDHQSHRLLIMDTAANKRLKKLREWHQMRNTQQDPLNLTWCHVQSVPAMDKYSSEIKLSI